MRDNQCGLPLPRPVNCFVDEGRRFGVDGRGCFIEDQNGGVVDDGTGRANPLTLPAGERAASLAEDVS